MTDPDASNPDARDRLVQSQYEFYPYPERNPDDEKRRLIAEQSVRA
jgi:hypothetical protein